MRCLLVNNGPNAVKFAAHVGTVQEVSTYLNEQEQANAASDAPTDGAAGGESDTEDEVVDAEFSEVDEDAKN